jgi:hypothetical protein
MQWEARGECQTYIRVVEYKGGGGIDWNGACICSRVRFLTGVDLKSIKLGGLVVVVRGHGACKNLGGGLEGRNQCTPLKRRGS